jgi:uncharacterized membrane protein
VSTGRLESFSDGVIAVAATLLVLSITPPTLHTHESLVHALLNKWPDYAAYAVSFVTIGIIWMNHHVMISRLRLADHVILMLNLILLMWIAVLPFATSLLATFLREGRGQHLAGAVYAGSLLAMSLSFSALNRHILLRKADLLSTEMDLVHRQAILRRSLTGLVPYAVAVALAALSAYATFAVCAAVAVFYALPVSRGE